MVRSTDGALVVYALLAAQMAWAVPANAQNADTDEDAAAEEARTSRAAQSDAAPGEIIVTAQRREQNLQSVPISITAISTETIKDANLTDTLSIAKLAPNTQVRVFGSAPNIFIRGVGLNDFNSSSLPPVAVYRDEFAVVAPASQIYPLFDLERVEVLKGPQGTLFGKNTTGGAISYISKRPGDFFEGEVVAGVGRFGERYFSGAVTLPVSDVFALRLSGASRQTDGDRINNFTGKRASAVDMQAARLVAVTTPSDDFKITTIAYWGRNHSDSPIPKPIGTLPGGGDALGYIDPDPDNPVLQNFNQPSGLRAKDFGVTNIIEASFGDLDVKSVTGYDRSKLDFSIDVDNSPNQLDEVFSHNKTKEFTQELTLSSKNDWVEWIVGGYYSWDRVNAPSEVNLLGSLASIGADLPLIITGGRTTRSYAGFAQATFSVTPSFRLTGGIRYTRDKLRSNVSTTLINGYFDPSVPDAAPIPIIPERVIDQKWGRFSYRVAVEYDFAPKILGYASMNHSFKGGGVYLVPLSSPNEADPFAPETNTAYEAGLKTTLFDNLLRLNVAGFFNNYKDLQAFAIGPTTSGIPSLTIQNAASAHIYGIEADFTLRPAQGLTFEGGVGWLHARYRKYPNAGTDPVTGGALDFSGNPLPGAPNWSGNLAATYEFEFGAGWNVALRGDYSYVGRRYFDPSKTALVSDSSYGLIDARLTVTPPRAPVSFALWGRNLGDTKYLANATDLRALGFIPQYYGNRRSYGAEVTVTF